MNKAQDKKKKQTVDCIVVCLHETYPYQWKTQDLPDIVLTSTSMKDEWKNCQMKIKGLMINVMAAYHMKVRSILQNPKKKKQYKKTQVNFYHENMAEC